MENTNEDHDVRKALAPLVALLIAFMCIAGVGAVYAYNAVTSSQEIGENDMNDQYILLKSDVNSAIATDVLNEIAFDSTRVTDTTYTFTVHGTTLTFNEVDYPNAMKVSKDNWTVEVEKHLPEDAPITYANTYNLVVTATDFTPTAGLTYILKVGTTAVLFTSNAWTINGLTYDTPYDVELYVAGTISTPATEPVSGFVNYDDSDAEHIVEGTVFTFTATAVEVTP